MPIFEFNCLECGEEFEIFARGGSNEKNCPDCGSDRIERKFSTFGLSIAGGRSVSSSLCSSGGCSGGSCGKNCKGCK